MGGQAGCGLCVGAQGFGGQDAGLDCRDGGRDHAVLQLENLGQRAGKSLAPDQMPGLRLDKLDIDPQTVARLLNAALHDVADAKLATEICKIDGFPLSVKVKLAAITKRARMHDRAEMRSLTIPSTRYSLLASPVRLAKGSTASEGLSGRGSAFGGVVGAVAASVNG